MVVQLCGPLELGYQKYSLFFSTNLLGSDHSYVHMYFLKVPVKKSCRCYCFFRLPMAGCQEKL